MEKQTRVNKYKELREGMKEEVAINHAVNESTSDEDDDFLSFLPKEEKKKVEDTLIEPLSYETLNQDNENVRNALNEAKVNVGKEKYDTRLDILNKIKQDSSDYQPAHEYKNEDISETKKNEPQKKMSLLEKLAAMSPEEDVEELKEYEKELTVQELMKEEIKPQKELIQEEEGVDEFEEEETENSKLVTFLNGIIIVFLIIFVILVVFIVKQWLF